MKNLSNWINKFKEERVQNNSLKSGDFLSAETSVLVTGPSKLSNRSPSELIPIGLVQNFTVSQGKQIFTYNELGSSQPFMIPGRTRTSASISRILFYGPSLMYVLNITSVSGDNGAPKISEIPAGVGGADHNAIKDKPTLPFDYTDHSNTEGGHIFPDSTNMGDLVVNLRSSFFNKPIGLGVILYDNESEPYGGFYLEECYINAHNMSIQSQAVVLMENVSLFSTNIVPINADTIAGISS